ncbi:MAG: CDP-diacylglycerol--glycerol-3-phosphate 3-phosphatidyltransferase [Thermodesulfatator sp.]|nr:MAG: CDP-diacylglycerol--glycerol-3-phosphate 3-phosphatidyltransferase [Thermodesulfatator sp.]
MIFRLTPNRLTLLRILLLPLACVLLYGGPRMKLTAVGVGSLLGFTDYLDGWLARRTRPSRLGALLDPVADKIFVAAVYLLLVHLRYFPYFPVALLLLREILVGGLRGRGRRLEVWPLARIKTAFQMVGAGLVILAFVLFGSPAARSFGAFAAWLAAALTWISAWPYLNLGLRGLSGKEALSLGKEILPPIFLLVLFPLAGSLWWLPFAGLVLYFPLTLVNSLFSGLAEGPDSRGVVSSTEDR